ncbi:amidohydrolase [Roseomonas mucosa]|nr:amidohydrolase [Roseomonas mucosa]
MSQLVTEARSADAASDAIPRVDVHAHYLPADYRAAALAAGHVHPDGMPELPAWSADKALALMDRLNIRTAMLSVSSPGVHFGDDAVARKLARSVNQQGAALVRAHPERFGLFAALPLPDVDGAIREAAYALDELAADGVAVETNHRGVYMGDAALDPLMAELDRRRAVVFMHPTSPHCAGCLALALGQPRPIIEFMFESTRAIANMLYRRTLNRFPNLRLIVTHAGAAMPVLADRIADQAQVLDTGEPLTHAGIFGTLRRLHYDLAGSPLPRLAPALLSIADPERLHYGSDWPFTPDETAIRLSKEIDETDLFNDDLRRRILFENAWTLFPRLKGGGTVR